MKTKCVLTAFFLGTSPLVLAAELCAGKLETPPIYLFTSATGALSTPDVIVSARATSDSKDDSNKAIGSPIIKMRSVSREEVSALCGQGYSVSTLGFDVETGKSLARTNGDRTKFYTMSYLPSSFTIGKIYIAGWGSFTYGNFWVPATMPAGHHDQWSAFDVVTTGFNSATAGYHFVHATMFDTSYPVPTWNNGKGIIGHGSLCGSWSMMMESWTPQPSTNVWAPDSCSGQFYDGVSYGFGTGANNVSQWQVYGQYYSGASTPFYSKALGTFNPNFLTNAAGVAFLVAGDGSAPLTETWTLSFTGVSSGTY